MASAAETMAERKRQRNLQEARQSGSVAPEVDVSTGQMINPHNPEFLTKRPWYLGENDAGPSLDHLKQGGRTNEKGELTLAEADRLVEEQRRKYKQSKGGSGVAVKKGQWIEALQRNRKPYRMCQVVKVHEKKNRFDLKFEDGSIEHKVKASALRVTQQGNRTVLAGSQYKDSYDSKRDQYHGYDRDSHNAKVTAKHEARETMRREIRDQQVKEGGAEGGKKAKKDDDDDDDGSDSDSDASDDDNSDEEFVQRDEDAKVLTTRLARQGGVGGAQMKVTARNLRIREDTAKYLRNLDPNSAYYDPKSRSMRDNPNPERAPETTDFAGDNFVRISGDAVGLAETQLFAWDAAEQGVGELHPQANPSQAELLKKQFKSRAEDLKMQQKKAVLDRYGGQEYLDGRDGLASAVDKTAATTGGTNTSSSAGTSKLRFGVSVTAQQYNPDGRVKTTGNASRKREPIKSKYEEDIYINGHRTVWGSFFHKGAFKWGYDDDHSLMKNSYCTGDTGRIANDESHEMQYGTGRAGSAALAQARGMLVKTPNNQKMAPPPSRSKLYGEADQNASLDEAKVKEALKRAAEQEASQAADKKRKYNSMKADARITEEDMEAYRLRKDRSADPMSKISSDEVLDYKQ